MTTAPSSAITAAIVVAFGRRGDVGELEGRLHGRSGYADDGHRGHGRDDGEVDDGPEGPGALGSPGREDRERDEYTVANDRRRPRSALAPVRTAAEAGTGHRAPGGRGRRRR